MSEKPTPLRPEEYPQRYCNGGIGPASSRGCGALATVVCTERGAPRPVPLPGLQWYACDDPRHQAGGSTEPIAVWFARVYAAMLDKKR